jgi:holin-like protein
MLQGFSILFVFYLLGELLVFLLDSPIPGSVAGMLLLFAALCWRDSAPKSLISTSEQLLLYLPLLLIPAGVGVIQYLDLLQEQIVAISASLILGTALSMIFISWFSRKFTKLDRQDESND